MSLIRDCLFYIAIAWLLTFTATLLLCLPSFFSRDSLSRPRRIPQSDTLATETPSSAPSIPIWRRVCEIILGSPMIVLAVLVVFPAVFTMAFVVSVHSYRYYRLLTYRALRRQHRLLAYPLSFSTGFMVFIHRLRHPHVTPTPGTI
jgi:hypothetical protein